MALAAVDAGAAALLGREWGRGLRREEEEGTQMEEKGGVGGCRAHGRRIELHH